MPTRGSIPGRLGSFILGHILCSVLYFFFSFLNFRKADPVSSTIAVVQIYLLPAALYLLAGCLFSLLRHWPRPDRKTASHSVLFPTLCAWGWAFGGCGLLLLFSGREALFPLAFTGFALLALSFLLASPSALFMLLTLDLLSGSLRDAGVNAFFQSSAWFAAMFLAGLLPPMLFFLGSLLPKKRLTTAKNVIK